MSLHQNLNNLTFLCNEVVSLNRSCFHLSSSIGSAKNEIQRMMYRESKRRLEEELEITIRRMKKMLNDHYATNNSCLFIPPEGVENATSSRNDEENSTEKHEGVNRIGT